MASSIRQQAARGVLLVSFLKVVGTIVGRLVQIVLPLYLLPIDFGIFAIATFFSGFLAIVGELGMSSELVQRKGRFEEAANTAFTLRMGLAVALVAMSVPLGLLVSQLYGNTRLALPILVLSIGVLIQALSMVPRAIATRRLDFRRAAIPDNAGKYAAGLVTVALAVLGFAYWSPVYGTLTGAILGTTLLIAFSRWRPKIEYRAELAREIVGFGRFVTLAAFTNFVAHSVDGAIAGFILGVAPVGYYALAYSWGVYFPSNLTSVLSIVGFPVLSQVSQDSRRFRRVLTDNVRYYAYAAVGMSVGVAVFAPVFVRALYGDVWVPAILPMQILASVGLLFGFCAIASDGLYALGRSRATFYASLGELAVLLVFLPFATVYWGLLGTSVAALVGAAVLSIGLALPLSRVAGLRARDWLVPVARPMAAGLVGAAAGGALTVLLGPPILALGIGLAVFIAAYAGVLQLATNGRFLGEIRSLLRLAVT